MHPHVLTMHSARTRIEREAGNKGRFLYELSSLGAPVPAWVVLGADVFDAYRHDSGLGAFIDARLAAFEPAQAERVSREIAEAIQASAHDAALRELLRGALALLGDVPLAVRSSGVEEDSAAYSFAGQFDSFLGVVGLEAVVESVKRCWASAYSARSLLYRQGHGLDFGAVRIGVVLQELVHAEVSGVVFTANPMSGNPYEAVVSAVYGLGEGLVSGAVDADVVTLDKYSGEIHESTLGGKQQRFTARGIEEVPAALQAVSCLDAAQLERIRQHALEIESAFGAPQDIEWCFGADQLWILQARPVTGAATFRTSHFDIWDNSNIIENYPGITAPLTFSFARHMYGRVFGEYCRMLHIPRRHRESMEGFLGALLGQANGRVYYNLLHWYKLVGVNPMQDLGRRMLEVQMGLTDQLDLERAAERIRPYEPASEFEHRLIRLVSGGRFFWMFARSEALVRAFVARFEPLFERYDAIDYAALPPETVFRHYKDFEREILAMWAPTVSLESAIGLSYGLLRILTKRWIPDAPPWFEVGVLGAVKDVASVEPARRLARLAKRVREDPALRELVRSTPSGELNTRLSSRQHAAARAEIDAYLRDFGYRANNELKLEEPDLREEPSVLFDMLKAALAAPEVDGSEREDRYEREAECIIRAHLNPLQRVVFQRVRGVARAAIRRRETVRFCRSRMFGVFRNMFRALGRGLAAHGLLEQPKDVFFLKREELDGCFEGSSSHREVRALVAQRKRDAEAYAALPELPPRFVSRGPLPVWLKWCEGRAPTSDAGDDDGSVLRGTACAPGLATGPAKVVREPGEFDGGILVTYRTDPGWIAVFPSAQALLIERGSPLTHAAIVAREVGIPTIVQIPGLTRRVQSGMTLHVDGERGVITLAPAQASAAE
jgi:phosphohistidine swiveling domain-containing protein